MPPDHKQQRDRKIFVFLAAGVIAYWALGLTATIYKREPYPALMMPAFLDSGGLEGTQYTYHRRVIVVTTLQGDLIEASLVDALIRNGFSKGQASELNHSIALINWDDDGEVKIDDPDHRIWDIALQGISPNGPMTSDQVQDMRLVLDEAIIDVRDWPDAEPTITRLAECKVQPWQP